MIGISVTVGTDLIRARLKARKRAIQLGLVDAIRQGTTEVHQRVADGIRQGGDYLNRRTGTLARALYSTLPKTGDTDPIGRVGFNLRIAKYARVQEMGGTITAKNARFLTIPIRDALTGNGVARFTARELIADPVKFGYSGTFFHRGMLFGRPPGKGNAIRLGLAQSIAVPLFVLKTSVTLPKREPLHRALREKRARIVELLVQARKAATA